MPEATWAFCRGRGADITYEQPAECTRKGCSGEKEKDAIELFVPLVPHGQIEHESRDEPGFRHTQKEAGDKKSGETLSETCEGANGTPRESESRKPESWSGAFEHEIRRDLE